jgi:tetratricopeptide (TPR) repeat protein
LGLVVILLVGCGDGSPSTDQRQLMTQGQEELARYEFTRAHACFSQVRAIAPAHDVMRREASLALAVACHHWQPASAERIAEAEALYRELSDAGVGDEAVQAQLQLGRLAELRDYFGDREDLPAARARYMQVMERWPQRPEAGEACLRLAAAWAQSLQREDVLRGVAVLEGWLDTHPDEAKASIMLQYLSELHWAFLGDARQAVDALRKADARGFDGENREWMFCWRLARLSEEELHDRDLAVRYYRRIVTDYPKCGAAWEAQQEMKRLGAEPPPIRLFDPASAVKAGGKPGRETKP